MSLTVRLGKYFIYRECGVEEQGVDWGWVFGIESDGSWWQSRWYCGSLGDSAVHGVQQGSYHGPGLFTLVIKE